MTFDEVLSQVQALLQREKRVSYRALKRRFSLDDDYLEDVKDELIKAKQLARDEEGAVLVWTGAAPVSSSKFQVPGSQPSAPSPQTLDARPVDGERRQLTVMFCDLVGSTALSAQLDPEELREVVRAYQETCTEVIRRYDGHIAQHLGDGLLVYFGYPAAHEDDAQRAVLTALAIVGAIRESPLLNTQLRHPVQVRIGIHTGLVVVGEIGSSDKREILALGETPNIAARVQATAAPDEVLISTATYHLVEGLFECEDRGRPDLKGVSTPLTLYRVLKAGEAQSRFQVVVRQGLTPLVGREHEYGLLRERWERVKDGAGQVVLLSGEPGIGKSRLVEALKETIEHEGAPCLELRCSPYTQNSALYPVIEHVQRVLQFRSDDSLEEKLRKLEDALKIGATHASPLQTEAIPLLAALLSLPPPEGYPPLSLSPQKQKEKTYEAIVAWLCAEAKTQAVTYAWEDLHWADPSTLELLALFLDQVPRSRLLAVLTYRPEFTPPWGVHSYVSQLTLSRLGRTQVEMMVEKVTGGKALPPEVLQQIASKTDGVPLFVEELTKMVVESDFVREVEGRYELNGPLPPLAIPSTLQDSLMARLDRLATVREIAQVGATIGREFNYDLLQAVSPLNEETLQRGLRQLVEAELVYQSGVPPQARYLFKHALVQDTAYQSLLKSRRQQLHQQVAQVLEERFAEVKETQPELLAHHYTEAGLIEQAIPYWQRAGQRAVQRSATVEAERHLTTALALLQRLPETPKRTEHELVLQVTLGTVLRATKGIAAPEVAQAYGRAWQLCQQVGETPQLFPLLFNLRAFSIIRGDCQTALAQAQHLLTLAQRTQDAALLVAAHYSLGMTLSIMGDFAQGCEVLKQGAALYDPEKHRSLAYTYSLDPGGACLTWMAQDLWYLGYPEQALQTIEKGLALIHELSHPFSLGFTLVFAGYIHGYRRECRLAQERAEAAITLATEQEFPHWLQYGQILRGWALAQQGQAKEGVAEIRRGLAGQRAAEAVGGWSKFLALLAEAYEKAGRPEEGLSALAEALALVDKTGDRYYEAELYRLKGMLTLQSQVQGPKSKVEEEVEECFHKALDVARQQAAKSWELRAATSLARLWQRQGKRAEAHQLLSEIYGWFTEGFDTKDLQEAKALLEELS